MAQSVLIVDDDPTQRRLMESVLTRQGYKVATAAGGREAIAFIDSGRASDTGVMLLDLVMPEVDGYGVLEHIKKALPGLPVIVLTAQGRIDTVVAAMRAGAHVRSQLRCEGLRIGSNQQAGLFAVHGHSSSGASGAGTSPYSTRSRLRARNSRVRTAALDSPSSAAISAVENPPSTCITSGTRYTSGSL